MALLDSELNAALGLDHKARIGVMLTKRPDLHFVIFLKYVETAEHLPQANWRRINDGMGMTTTSVDEFRTMLEWLPNKSFQVTASVGGSLSVIGSLVNATHYLEISIDRLEFSQDKFNEMRNRLLESFDSVGSLKGFTSMYYVLLRAKGVMPDDFIVEQRMAGFYFKSLTESP